MKKITYFCDKCGKSINTEKEPYIAGAQAKAVMNGFSIQNYSNEEEEFLEKYLENHYVRNQDQYTHGYDILCKNCGELFIKRVDSLRSLLKTF